MKKLKFLLLSIMLCIVSFIGYSTVTCVSNYLSPSDEYKTDSIELVIDSLQNEIDSTRQELIKEVTSYIENSHDKFDKKVGVYFVDQFIDNNIDLCFGLAQAKIETNFGSLGAGKSRKSMFGVYNRNYKSYEDCIDHYLSNLHKNYINDSRDIHVLMKNYTTHSGHRYAEDLDYERKLTAQYKIIRTSTRIEYLESQYRQLRDELRRLT